MHAFEKLDMYGYDRQIERELSLLKQVPQPNQNLILGYLEYRKKRRLTQEGKELSPARQKTIICRWRIISREAEHKSIKKMNLKDLQKLELALATNRRSIDSYWPDLAGMFNWLDVETGARCRWIRSRKHRKSKTPYKAEDQLTEEEQRAILNASINPQERAYIAFRIWSGARPGEDGNARIKAVALSRDDPARGEITLDGKTGARVVPIYDPLVSYLKEHLGEHPLRGNPNAPLWVAQGGKPFTAAGLRKMLKRVLKRAKIDMEGRKLTPYLFRHQAYTSMQKKGIPQAIREKYFGHAHGSKMSSIYTQLSREDVTEALDEMHGVTMRRKPKEELKMQVCWKCHAVYPPHVFTCKQCGNALDQGIYERHHDARDLELSKIKEKMAELQDMVEILGHKEVHDAKKRRELISGAVEWKKGNI